MLHGWKDNIYLKMSRSTNETYTKSELEILAEEEQRRQEEFEKLEDYLCAINPGRERLKYREVFFEIKK
jgi:hypothetical protein